MQFILQLSCVVLRIGTRSLGEMLELLPPSPNSKAPEVPLTHAELRLPAMQPNAFLGPETLSLSCLATPGHITKLSGMTLWSIGKSCLHSAECLEDLHAGSGSRFPVFLSRG